MGRLTRKWMRVAAWVAALAWCGGTAAAAHAAPSATAAARVHFFGAENVDRETGAVRDDRVILSWFGISSLAVAMKGHVVLLDAYVNNANSSTPTSGSDRYVDTSYRELADLRPEALFIGHDHGDHGLGVSFLAHAVPGLKVFGTAEHCAQAHDDAATNGYAGTVDCLSVLPAGSPVGGAVPTIPAIPGVCTQVVKHLHSAAEPPNPDYRVVQSMPDLPSLSSIVYHGPGPSSAEPIADDVTGLKTAGDEGGSLLWQFSLGAFTLTWNDTSGPLWVDHPDVYDLFRHRLWPTSVEANAILGFDAPLNGWLDPALYVKHVQPKVMVPLHHDLVFTYNTSRTFPAQFRAQESAVGIPAAEQPHLDWVTDPEDYLRPLVYDPAAPVWRTPRDPSRPASPCASSKAAAPGTAPNLGLPSSRRALRRHWLVFRLHAPAGTALRSARVLVDGRRRARLTGRRLAAPVRLRLRGRRARVTIVARTAAGETLRQTRDYRMRATAK
jgi:hypothetical protein